MTENVVVTDTDSVDINAQNAAAGGPDDALLAPLDAAPGPFEMNGKAAARRPVVSTSLAPQHPDAHGAGNFPGIGDYAFLSDCESNCLIAPSGAIEWMCVPRPDSPSVFTALLDRAGGSFRVAPFGVAVP